MVGQYGFGNFSDLFGEEFAVMEETAPTPKKEATKKTSGKETKKAEKKAAPIVVTLPITVYAPSFQVQVMPSSDEGEGAQISAEELVKRLIDLGYVELNNLHRDLFVDTETNAAYVVEGASSYTAVADDTLLNLDEDKQVTFAYGMEKIEYKLSDFDGKETDEVDLAALKEKLKTHMPKYANIPLGYDVESGIVTPIFEVSKRIADNTEVTLPFTISCLGDDVTVSEEDFPEGEKITAGIVVKHLSKKFICKGLCVSLYRYEDAYFMGFTYTGKAKVSASKDAKKNKGQSAKKKAQKFTLPVDIYLTMNGHRETLTSEMFDGKEKITAEDLTAYYSDKYAVFKSAEKVKGLNFTHDEVANILTVDSTPGRRGAAHFYNAAYDFEEVEHYAKGNETPIIINADELANILTNVSVQMRGHIGGSVLPYCGYDFFSNRIATYFFKENIGVNTDVAAQLKIPKIPNEIFCEITDYFKSNLPNEAICRVLYDHKKQSYFVDYPTESTATAVTVDNISFAPTPYTCDVALTIHSHDTMPAFFSHIDNEAERWDIGFFGVMGKLDTEQPETKLRVAVEGGFTEVNPSFLFDGLEGDVAYE